LLFPLNLSATPETSIVHPLAQQLPMHAPAQPANDWGVPPWKIDFTPPAPPVPKETDFAVVGAGFTGLAAAAWLRRSEPSKSVAVFEAGHIGSGASGRTGGMALAESAAGDLPGLGDVLGGVEKIFREFCIDSELNLLGAWEIARGGKPVRGSRIDWTDSGRLRATAEVPGGTLDPGKVAGGLARAAQERGALVFEKAGVTSIEWSDRPTLHVERDETRSAVHAGKILFATNALSLELSGIAESGMGARLTLAVATEPLGGQALRSLGLDDGKPFYTDDLPYLWGRTCNDTSTIWGGGLVSAEGLKDLSSVSIHSPETVSLFASLEARVRGLHPVLNSVRFTHRWGGPILFRESWTPVFDWHPRSKGKAIVLGAFAGHGVMLSSYLGRRAAEALLGRSDLPTWGKLDR
jgi:glycine/D-amino acid oxidase-like deaminating enzyme